MMKSKLFNSRGTITINRINYIKDSREPRQVKESQQIIDICLNCTKKKCNGNCAIVRGVK